MYLRNGLLILFSVVIINASSDIWTSTTNVVSSSTGSAKQRLNVEFIISTVIGSTIVVFGSLIVIICWRKRSRDTARLQTVPTAPAETFWDSSRPSIAETVISCGEISLAESGVYDNHALKNTPVKSASIQRDDATILEPPTTPTFTLRTGSFESDLPAGVTGL